MDDGRAASKSSLATGASVVCGTAFHAPVLGHIEVLGQHLFCFDDTGTLLRILDPNNPDYANVQKQSKARGAYTELSHNQYLLPGFVDLHVHAPQWPLAGKGLNLPVMEWLDDYAIPLEAKYQDVEFAERVYQDVVQTLLANGTTTAMYFATVHTEATLRLAQICQQRGQRALVGKVVMDNELCPDFYRDISADQAVSDTKWMLEAIPSIPGNRGLVHPVITPRFIPNCSDKVLSALGGLAQDSGAHVQTHCAESDWVCQHVNERMGKSDAQSLGDFGLMTRRTVLAHANFIGEQDACLVRRLNSALAHCPLSNAFFANSVLPVASYLRAGTHMGLGTDISAGYTPSMFDSMRQSIVSSRMLEDGVDPEQEPFARQGQADSRINFREAFWMATTGGGQSLDLPIGYFDVGQQWDAQIIDLGAPNSNISQYDALDDEIDILQKILNGSQRCNVHKVWVSGKIVYSQES